MVELVPEVMPYVYEVLKSCRSTFFFLDCGCGLGKWGMIIKHEVLVDKELWSLNKEYFLVGCDVWKPYLLELRNLKVYDELVKCDVAFLPFKKEAFHLVLMTEVLEHVGKKKGYKTINEAMRITRRRIILSTPSYFFHVCKGTRLVNPYDEHFSIWTATDFSRLGFKVRGVGSRVRIPGLGAFLPLNPIALSRLSTPMQLILNLLGSLFLALARSIVPISRCILAIKDKKDYES